MSENILPFKTGTDHPRRLDRLITARRQLEGRGFSVRRPLPADGIEAIDPFLTIDEVGPVDYEPGEAVGTAAHPHRGVETVTYLLEGELVHEDSCGTTALLSGGDLQWITAGAGIVHAEKPSQRIVRNGGRIHGFQIWINLPSSDKMTAPADQTLPSSSIPTVSWDDGRVIAKVIAGSAFGENARIETRTPLLICDVSVKPGGSAEVAIPDGHNCCIYVFEGAIRVPQRDGSSARSVEEGQLAVLERDGALRLSCPDYATSSARMLLLAGRPIGEPVARYGPFVMNTNDELEKAFADFRAGRMGRIRSDEQQPHSDD